MISNTGRHGARGSFPSMLISIRLPIGSSFPKNLFDERLVHDRDLARAVHLRFRQRPPAQQPDCSVWKYRSLHSWKIDCHFSA